jgi:Protein of unknown function (DUF1573)
MYRKLKFSAPLVMLAASTVFLLFAFRVQSRSEEKAPDKLNQRVTEFYNAIRTNQMDKATQYVVEKARDSFRSQSHGKFLAFEITRVEMEQGGQSAIVELSFKVLIATIVRQIYVPDRTRWKLVSGEWFYDPEDMPPQLGDKMKEYYYDKQPPADAKSPKTKSTGRSLVPFERDFIDIGLVERGKILNLRFPFTNQSSQEIKIEEFYFRDAPFLKSTTTRTEFKPGEKGEISVDLDTSELSGPLDHAFFVEFQPIKEMASLRIKGKVSVKQKTEAPKAPPKSFAPSTK